MEFFNFSFPIQKNNILFSHSYSENYGLLYCRPSDITQMSNIEKAENFLIQISGAVPRTSLIRKLLLLIFPKGSISISIRKIKRSSFNDLIKMIGENLILIQSLITDQIISDWMKIGFDKLSFSKRNQKTDSLVRAFTSNYFRQYQ
jgi:hypothetical protein